MKQTTCPHPMISSKNLPFSRHSQPFPSRQLRATRRLGTKNLTFDVMLSTSDVTSNLLWQQPSPTNPTRGCFFLVLALSAYFLEYTNESYVSKTLPRIPFPSFSEQTTKTSNRHQRNFTKTQKNTWDLRTFTHKFAPFQISLSPSTKKKQLLHLSQFQTKELSASQMTKS